MTALRIDSGAAPLRRRLGPVPWFVLEELVLLAGADSVVETNVRAWPPACRSTRTRWPERSAACGPRAWWRATRSRTRPGGSAAASTRPAPSSASSALTTSSRTRSTQPRTPTAVPHPTMSLQLSLIDDGVDDDAAHSDPLRLTSAGEDDALAPGVRGRAAPVPRATQDGGGRALC